MLTKAIQGIASSSLPCLRNRPFTLSRASFQQLSTVIFTIITACIVPLFLRKNIRNAVGVPIPSGPLLRYAFLRKYPERALHRWAKKYGPLFSIWMGDQLFIVISDPHVARDLLVTQGAIFSSRKKYFMKNQVILAGRAITASAYDDTWRHHRRIAMQLLTPKAIQTYADVLDYEAAILIRSLYYKSEKGTVPLDPASYAGRYALNNMLTISFGTRTTSSTASLVERALQLAMEFMDLTGPWSNAVDFIVPLQWIPTSTRSRGRRLHDDLIEVYGAMYLDVKSRMDGGEIIPECLVRTLIETSEVEELDWTDTCMLAAVFTLGGVHSTSGIIQWFLALLPSHPDIQARAHDELDRVIGRDHWPSAGDEAHLPYIRAIIKEVQRVHAPFWMATPHCSTEDYEYNGMFIPKDTVMVLNCFTMHHNEDRYPDSYTFNPDRYLGDDLSCAESAKLSNVDLRDHWTFGAGRRICPGLVVAERELFLAISRILWTFTVKSIPSEPISLEEYEGMSGRTPLPFRVKFEPRNDSVHGLVENIQEIKL
ncbi:cytochrome P450 [Mycena albidolilacea]|uniref:Cytochrome P450 n=1 Tax=Mycena albidolilacea TaxID=1033008 RepID=A0AAD6ZT78_9AGAR|nr:cytochrome P450 [Mycena albidolilacea]